MRDLCDKTGLPRQAIHFYIQQGLVPEGLKTGRNTALYGDPHVERIRLVRTLQEERFLPLRAIRAVLDEGDSALTPAQRRLVADVRAQLPASLTTAGSGKTVPARELLQRTG